MPQLVDSSGVKWLQAWKPPARIGAAPPEPPRKEMPPGLFTEAATLQPVALLGIPLPPMPLELWIFQAPESFGGKGPLGTEQPVSIAAVVAPNWPRFWPAIATLASGEISPNTGARNELPHAPRMVKSSNGAQLNATLGLLVPATSLYWS